MNLLSFCKGALAMFWLVALLNLLYPFAAPLGSWYNWLALIVLIAHVAEAALFNRQITAQPKPWLGRLQVLLFGVLHIQSPTKAQP